MASARLAYWHTCRLLPLITGIIGNLLLKRRGRRLVDADWQELLDELSHRLGLRRKVTLLVGGPDQMPMTFGWLHPYVVLPSDGANWPARSAASGVAARVGSREAL